MPLKATGQPGPPRIVEIQEKYSAVEGESMEQGVKEVCWASSMLNMMLGS